MIGAENFGEFIPDFPVEGSAYFPKADRMKVPFKSTDWTKTRCVISDDFALGPFAGKDAGFLSISDITANFLVRIVPAFLTVAPLVRLPGSFIHSHLTISFFLKNYNSPLSLFELCVFTAGGSSYEVPFSFAGGSVFTGSGPAGGAIQRRVEYWGNDWYRCSATFNFNELQYLNGFPNIFFDLEGPSVDKHIGEGILIYGPQIDFRYEPSVYWPHANYSRYYQR